MKLDEPSLGLIEDPVERPDRTKETVDLNSSDVDSKGTRRKLLELFFTF